ncbi:MAG: 5-deoxy-glucuronate isomerase [Acidobacteria bacterium]|nr:5-deoxy-glucuronate isomerase [Acidobacteriota bacterium]
MAQRVLIRPRHLAPNTGGVLLDISPKKAGWEFVRFTVRRISPGSTFRAVTRGEECAVVLLRGAGEVTIDDGGPRVFGPRASVFDSYPHALYLPDGHAARFLATELSEIAECRAPSTATLEPRLVAPTDCGFEIRGGGNATRQIVDILPPTFLADRLLICEVFTPSGNWSSYPPHKHEVDNPPEEVDLEEIYYYRMRQPDGYGLQRLYSSDGTRDETVKVVDGDVILVRDGYHPYVSAFGADSYYLNVLAGSRRSMAASDDPRYAALRGQWPAPDPRVPVVRPPYA